MAKTTKPIYLTSLSLNNVRGFGEGEELSLCDAEGRLSQWTILLGENNLGKTTLLQCLAWMRPEPSFDASDNEIGIEPALTGEPNDVVVTLVRSGVRAPMSLRLTLA